MVSTYLRVLSTGTAVSASPWTVKSGTSPSLTPRRIVARFWFIRNAAGAIDAAADHSPVRFEPGKQVLRLLEEGDLR